MSPNTWRWVALCAGAEAIGMTAAATAARASEDRSAAVALTLVVAGGLVEGVALGVLQGRGLLPWLPGLNRREFALATVLVAGLGWAAASAPSVLAADDGADAGPGPAVVLLGAAGLGLSMGAVLGAVQAATMRSSARHPWRWVTASTIAWIPAMMAIFAGATSARTSWPIGTVALWGTLTGLVAGALLGLATAVFLPTLNGPPLQNLAVMAALRSERVHLFDGSLVLLRITGRRTGRRIELPAQFADDGARLVVMPGHAEHKTWWRNLEGGAELEVEHRGVWQRATGTVLRPGDPGYEEALSAYRGRWPRVTVPADQPLVRLEVASLATAG